MRKFILTIDQGTTSSRVTVYNNRFNVVDTIKKEFTQFFPNDGWVEHNALEIWNDVKALISKILKKNKFNIIDLGPTNEGQKINYGLLKFKRRFNGRVAIRKKFQLLIK